MPKFRIVWEIDILDEISSDDVAELTFLDTQALEDAGNEVNDLFCLEVTESR